MGKKGGEGNIYNRGVYFVYSSGIAQKKCSENRVEIKVVKIYLIRMVQYGI